MPRLSDLIKAADAYRSASAAYQATIPPADVTAYIKDKETWSALVAAYEDLTAAALLPDDT